VSQLDVVENESLSNVVERNNYEYEENCPYQMTSGFGRSYNVIFPCCPDLRFALIDITLQFVPRKTTFGWH